MLPCTVFKDELHTFFFCIISNRIDSCWHTGFITVKTRHTITFIRMVTGDFSKNIIIVVHIVCKKILLKTSLHVIWKFGSAEFSGPCLQTFTKKEDSDVKDVRVYLHAIRVCRLTLVIMCLCCTASSNTCVAAALRSVLPVDSCSVFGCLWL